MSGRFTAKRAPMPQAALPADQDLSSAADGISWTVFPEPEPARPAAAAAPANPLHSDKLLDAKVRLHRRLIEEINLSAIEKVSEGEVRRRFPRWSPNT
jgi:pilus assembly protein CpaF